MSLDAMIADLMFLPTPRFVRTEAIYTLPGIRDAHDALLREREDGTWEIYSPVLERWLDGEGKWIAPPTLGYGDVPEFDCRFSAGEAYHRYFTSQRTFIDARLFGLEKGA